jgi:hypothetical protein
MSDPRCGPDRTVAGGVGGPHHGWNPQRIGWSADEQRSAGMDQWAAFGRATLQDLPVTDAVVYDLSFEVNAGLWDRYFLTAGGAAELARFAADPAGAPLPNRRLAPHRFGGAAVDAAALADFHRAAAHLLLDGAFNVNSTSVEAWLALLAATRGRGANGGAVFPRLVGAPGGAWDGATRDRARIWAGERELSDDELRRLAQAMVAEVRARGPFLGLGDFVNRRLGDGPAARSGPVQAAIDAAGLNATLREIWPLANDVALPDYRHPDSIDDPTALDQRHKPATHAWGAPGHLTQADVLQVIGPALAARSDSFVVRAYGDAVDAGGRVQARAWCEAVVQRVPEPLQPDPGGLDPREVGAGVDFGRRFVVRGFRWLHPREI